MNSIGLGKGAFFSRFYQKERASSVVLMGSGIRTFRSAAKKRIFWMQKARYMEKYRKPTLDIAKAMPMTVSEMENSALVTLASIGNHDACAEVLKRHIMSRDLVSYDEACVTFATIEEKAREGLTLVALPYQVGIVAALTAGFASFPLCFHFPTVTWFNEFYVTADVPEPKDLETALEVGSWAWNWMEPPLGQISFFLLCLQFIKEQMSNLGVRPYTSKMKHIRAQRLAKAFPQYDPEIVKNYSETMKIAGD